MNCREFLSRHSEYVDALVDSVEAERLRSHAAACASCARYDRVVRRGTDLARDLLPRFQVSEDFVPRVRHRLFHVRDDMARRRPGTASLFAAVASVIVIAAGAAVALAVEVEAVPVVDSAPVWAAAPVAFTPLRIEALARPDKRSSAASKLESPPAAVAMIEAEAAAHDPHIATPAGWPVYSRSAMAVAFPGAHTAVVVTPADFRQSSTRRPPAGALLIRH